MDETRYPKFIIYIMFLDEADPVWIPFVDSVIRNAFGCAVKALEPAGQPLPAEAYEDESFSYDAIKVLSFIRPKLPDDGSRIIGITCQNLFDQRVGSTVAGMADGNWPAANGVIISLRTAINGAPDVPDKSHLGLFLSRFHRLILHEIGHTFVKPKHCQDSRCIMCAGSRDERALDSLGNDFCRNCQKKIEENFRLENNYIERFGETLLCYAKRRKSPKTDR